MSRMVHMAPGRMHRSALSQAPIWSRYMFAEVEIYAHPNTMASIQKRSDNVEIQLNAAMLTTKRLLDRRVLFPFRFDISASQEEENILNNSHRKRMTHEPLVEFP